MAWLLADGPQPVLAVVGATAAALLAAGAFGLRRRADRFGNSVLSVFLSDAGTVSGSLAVTLAVVSAALALGVDGVGRPLWLIVAVVAAAIAGGLLLWRWRQELAS